MMVGRFWFATGGNGEELSFWNLLPRKAKITLDVDCQGGLRSNSPFFEPTRRFKGMDLELAEVPWGRRLELPFSSGRQPL